MNSQFFGIIKVSDKIYVSIFAVFALIFFIIGQGFIYSMLFFSSVLLHEASHLFFLQRYGAKINRVTLFPFGIDIAADTTHLSYKNELICTLAGSGANLIFCVLSYFAMYLFPSPQILFFVLCNAFLGCINLIPISFFDGGKALRLLFYDNLDIDTAFYLYKALDILSALIFLCFSFFVISCTELNFSVCVTLVYAAVSTIALYKKDSS